MSFLKPANEDMKPYAKKMPMRFGEDYVPLDDDVILIEVDNKLLDNIIKNHASGYAPDGFVEKVDAEVSSNGLSFSHTKMNCDAAMEAARKGS